MPEGSEHDLALVQAKQAHSDLCAIQHHLVTSCASRKLMGMVRRGPDGSSLAWRWSNVSGSGHSHKGSAFASPGLRL
jgi:hypothetical protein